MEESWWQAVSVVHRGEKRQNGWDLCKVRSTALPMTACSGRTAGGRGMQDARDWDHWRRRTVRAAVGVDGREGRRDFEMPWSHWGDQCVCSSREQEQFQVWWGKWKTKNQLPTKWKFVINERIRNGTCSSLLRLWEEEAGPDCLLGLFWL